MGGSDEHTADEQVDRRLGRPTTVVYADELSEPALVAGLHSGRVYVRTGGPDGPAMDMWGVDAAGCRVEMGGNAAAGPLVLHAQLQRADGQELRWIRRGATVATVTVEGEVTRLPADARDGDWFSLVLADDRGPTLFSNAIYVARAGGSNAGSGDAPSVGSSSHNCRRIPTK